MNDTITFSIVKDDFDRIQYGAQYNNPHVLHKRVTKDSINLFCGIGSSVFHDFSKVVEFKPRDSVKFIKVKPQSSKDKRESIFELNKIEMVQMPIGKNQYFAITLGKKL